MSFISIASFSTLRKINYSKCLAQRNPWANRFFSQYLETLCDLLYDDLRPRILHEPRLTVLCEVCTVLQALMVLDASSLSTPSTSTFSLDESEASDDDDNTTTTNDDQLTIGLPRGNGPGQSKKMGRQLHTSYLLNMVLQDAQTRLFFKAQSVIQSEIRHFSPKPEDLAYPDILVGQCLVLDCRNCCR